MCDVRPSKYLAPFAALIMGVSLGQISDNVAWAEEFTVTVFEDGADGTCDSDCTLREAIIAANENAENNNTIILPEGTYTLSIRGVETRNEGENLIESIGGSTVKHEDASIGDLDIEKNLTLIGADQSTTIIDGGNTGAVDLKNRIFEIYSPNNIDRATVDISNITIQNGAVLADNGGAFANGPLGLVTLTNVTVKDSSTTNDNAGELGLGGGVYNAGIMTIVDGTISGNDADVNQVQQQARFGGGGIYNDDTGTMTLRRTQVSGNSATNSALFSGNESSSQSFATGGGILNVGELVIRDQSTIGGSGADDANRSFSGGGVSNIGGFITITQSTITNNSTFDAPIADLEAGRAGRTGGGFHSQNAGQNRGNVLITATTISNNFSHAQGGGLFNSGSPLTITHSTINNNTGRFIGGGLSNVGSIPAEITNSTIAFNRSFDETATEIKTDINNVPRGGGIFTSSRVNLNAVTIAGNTATNEVEQVGLGGQIFVQDNSDDGRSVTPQLTFTNTIIAHAQSDDIEAANNCGGATEFIVSNDFNIDTGNSCSFDRSSDKNGSTTFDDEGDVVSVTPLDVLLDSQLRVNQGIEGTIPPTETLAILDGSPAIDMRDLNGCPARDQRYFVRTNRCDAGAFEVNAEESSSALTDLKISLTEDNDPVDVDTQLTYTITVVNIGPDDAEAVDVTINLPSSRIDAEASVLILENNLGACTNTNSTTIVCADIGTIADGDTNRFPAFDTVRISVTITPRETATLSTTVTVTSADPASDYFADNNQATETTAAIVRSVFDNGGVDFAASNSSGSGSLAPLMLLMLLIPLVARRTGGGRIS